MTSDGEPVIPNNPAGRVLTFLREFQRESARETNNMRLLMRMLDEPQESARIYLTTLRLRMQTESVPALMAPYERESGYRGYVRNYSEVLDAVKRLEFPHQGSTFDVFRSLQEPGWTALEFADDVLSKHAAEVGLTAEQEADHLGKVRGLIDAIARDESLSPGDRGRVVDLLRKVEQALLDIKINGALPVQEAVAAAGAIVRLSLWENVMSRPWARDFGIVMAGLFMAIEGTANVLAIEQYFSHKPQEVVVIESRVHDNGQSAESSDEARTPPGR